MLDTTSYSGTSGVTIYFPLSWTWGMFWLFFDERPEMEALEPDIRTNAANFPELADQQWGAM